MTYLLPLFSLVAGLIGGFVLRNRGQGMLAGGLVVGLIALAAWLIVQGRSHQGFDGIGYAIGAILICAPTAFGLLCGIFLAWRRLRKM